jgi:hypothetical protein
MSDTFNVTFGAFHKAHIGKHTLPERISEPVLLMKKAHQDMHQALLRSGHLHVGYVPVTTVDISPLIMYLTAEHFAEQWAVPIAWVLALPMDIKIDPAICYMNVKSDSVLQHHLKDGTVDDILYAAFLEGKDYGIVEQDEPFMFERDPVSEAFTQANGTALSAMADSHDLTAEEYVDEMFGDGTDDWSFPA